MKTIDFGIPGGLPFTQNILGRMQTSYLEGIMALAAIGGDVAGPILVTGMAVTEPTPGTVAVSSGWFIADGKLISFPGGSVVPGVGEFAIVQIVPTTGNLTFNNGSVEPVLLEPVGELIAGASASAPNFKIADLKPWGRELGWNVETPFDVGLPSVEGTLKYKKSELTNVLYLMGELYASTAGACDALPAPAYYELLTLPVGYRPSSDVYFTAAFVDVFATGYFFDSTGDVIIRHINCKLETNGKLSVEWLPDDGTAPAGYWIRLSEAIPLD